MARVKGSGPIRQTRAMSEGRSIEPRRRWRRRLGWGVLVLVLLPLVPLLGAKAWVGLTARGDTFAEVSDVPQRDVVIVLGAGLRGGAPSPYLRARLDLARDLLAEGTAKVVLVSGDNRTQEYDEPTAMRDYLVGEGVPAELIVRDYAGRDTYDTCVRAKQTFGVDEAVVVTQGYHLPRAVATCRAVGLDAVGLGDWSMKTYGSTWRAGSLREYPANVKAAWDVLAAREPVLGEKESGVRDALEEHSLVE